MVKYSGGFGVLAVWGYSVSNAGNPMIYSTLVIKLNALMLTISILVLNILNY
jgi:hypothetical protein